MVMVKAGMQRIKDRMTFLKSVPLLKGVDTASLARVADCLEVVNNANTESTFTLVTIAWYSCLTLI